MLYYNKFALPHLVVNRYANTFYCDMETAYVTEGLFTVALWTCQSCLKVCLIKTLISERKFNYLYTVIGTTWYMGTRTNNLSNKY